MTENETIDDGASQRGARGWADALEAVARDRRPRRPGVFSMRRALPLVLIATGVLMAVGVAVFHFSLELTWSDSAYFVVATVTTVGYGDINLQNAPVGIKLFGSFLMVAGAASMAAAVGMITDFLLRLRLQELLGARRRRMHNHIVLCGLGNVGFRVLEQLLELGEDVVVVEKDDSSKFLEEARARNVPVIVGDIRLTSILEEAAVADAACLIAATDDDLANLDAALTARSVKSDIRVVLRMFDQNLAGKIRKGFDIETAFSTSALAAPAFAMAAVDASVVGAFHVGDDLVLSAELAVCADAELDGMTTAELEEDGGLRVLAHADSATARRRLFPRSPIEIRAGDRITVSARPERLRRLRELNAPPAGDENERESTHGSADRT